MNGRTSKLLRRLALATQLPYRPLKRAWNTIPRPFRRFQRLEAVLAIFKAGRAQ